MYHNKSSLVQSFKNAFNGWLWCVVTERNMKIHVAISGVVIVLAFFFALTTIEWIIIISCIVVVQSLELVNTAIEQLCNAYDTKYNPTIKYIKDVAAAAVLIAALAAAIIGIIIFYPYIF